MTFFVATTTLSRRSARQARANLICYQVNKRAITDDFMEDERRVRETLNTVAEPQVQHSLEISIEPLDV